METARTDRFKTAIMVMAATGLLIGLAFRVSGKAGIVWFAGGGLAIVAALSTTVGLVFGETLAAAVVMLMYSGGEFLESFAEGRAWREMHDLLSRVPRTATRHRSGGLEDVPLETSALTGESLPVRLGRGDDAMSGATNVDGAFGLNSLRLVFHPKRLQFQYPH